MKIIASSSGSPVINKQTIYPNAFYENKKNPTFYEALGREQFPFVTVQVRVKLSARVPSALRPVFVCLSLRLSKTPRNIY